MGLVVSIKNAFAVTACNCFFVACNAPPDTLCKPIEVVLFAVTSTLGINSLCQYTV